MDHKIKDFRRDFSGFIRTVVIFHYFKKIFVSNLCLIRVFRIFKSSFLLLLAIFVRTHSNSLFENTAKIIRVTISGPNADLLNTVFLLL